MWFFVFIWFMLCMFSSGEEEKLAGGKEVLMGEFPFAVQMSGKVNCGGTLLQADKFFTTADCFTVFDDFKVDSVIIISGSVNLLEGSPGRQERKLKSYKMHPKFKEKSTKPYFFHNIAIAFVDKPFILTDTLKAITFPAYSKKNYEQMWYDHVASGANCLVVGWGKSADGTQNDVLKAVEVTPWTNADCSKIWKPEDDMTGNGEACASAVKSEELLVPADAGSALYCKGQVYGMVTYPIRSGRKRIMGFILFWPYLEQFKITKQETASAANLCHCFSLLLQYVIPIFFALQLHC